LFSRIDALSDWPNMLDQALANPNSRKGRDYGRALCGVAFAHWQDKPDRGYAAAKQAISIFESVPGSDLDLANALRHVGLCSYNRPKGPLPLYRQALAIFERLGDDRGRAHTMLSIAQSGFRGPDGPSRPSPLAAERIKWAIRAADIFRSLHNGRMLNEATSEIETNLPFVPRAISFDGVRRRARSELTVATQSKLADYEITEQIGLLVWCMRIDVDLQDWARLREDTESILRNPTHFHFAPADTDLLAGFYLALCHKLGRSPESMWMIQNWNHNPNYDRGRSLTPEEAVEVASRLASSP
jgi:hypothetical protein